MACRRQLAKVMAREASGHESASASVDSHWKTWNMESSRREAAAAMSLGQTVRNRYLIVEQRRNTDVTKIRGDVGAWEYFLVAAPHLQELHYKPH